MTDDHCVKTTWMQKVKGKGKGHTKLDAV